MSQGEGGGRPLLFKTEKELQSKIDSYLAECNIKKKIITITGLAVYLETSRETLMNYQRKEKYFATIKKAKDFIESQVEERLLSGKQNAAGPIFWLKNFNWSDKQEIQVGGTIKTETKDITELTKLKDEYENKIKKILKK